MGAFRKTLIRLCLGMIGIGIVLIIIGIGCGADMRKTFGKEDATDFSETYQGVKNIKITSDFGKVIIEEGDTFSIQATNVWKERFKSYVEGGTWIIEQKEDSLVQIWGISVSPFRVGIMEDDYGTVRMTVPKDFKAEKMQLSIGAGEIQIKKSASEQFDLKLGAGKATMTDISVAQDCSLRVGAGEINMTQMQVKNIDLDCGAGKIGVQGDILGNGKANCGIGEIQINLNGKETDFSYDVKCGIGEVKINKQSYQGIANVNQKKHDTDRTFNLQCGIGSIQLNTEE